MHFYRYILGSSHCPIGARPLAACLLVFACLLLLPFAATGQHLPARFTTEEYLVEAKIWDRKDGLASLEVGGLFQDSRGFVWIQNYNKLFRFDGHQFNLVDTIGFTEEIWYKHPFGTVDIDEDIHGNIWRYFHATNEVRIYDPATNRPYTLPEYLGADTLTLPRLSGGSRMISMNQVIYFINDLEGAIWAYDGSFKRVFQDAVSCYWQHNTPELVQDQQRYVYYLPGPNKKFWIIHRELGVMLCDRQGAILAHYPELSPAIYHFFIAADNQLYYYPLNPEPGRSPELYLAGGPRVPLKTWPGSHREFYRRNFLANPPDGPSIITEGYGTVDLTLREKGGSSQNLLKLIWDIVNYPLEMPGELMVLSSALPCQTANGDIWFSTNMGLVQVHFQRRRFKAYFQGYSFRSISWLDDKAFYGLYYGNTTAFSSIFRMEGEGRIAPSPFAVGAPYVTIHNKETWLSYNGALAHYDQAGQLRKKFIIPRNFAVKTQDFYNPLFLSSGNILYCNEQGLFEIDTADNSRFVLEGIHVECLMQDKKGDIWVGTAKGIYHLATQTMFLSALPHNKSLFISHIHEAPDGSFWLATDRGLVRWKPFEAEFEQFTTQQGLSNNTLHAVYPGPGEWLWLSSNHGIMAFNRQTKKVRSFFMEDGLAHNEQNRRAHSLGPDGRLYFGGVNGITRFDPNDVSFDEREKNASSSIFLHTISYVNSDNGSSNEIFRGLVSRGETPFSLPAGALQLDVNLAQPFFNDEINHQMEWRIAGYYPNWTPVPIGGALAISGLPAGRFDLEIRSRDISNTDNVESLVVPFRKAYMFYQRPSFWLLVVMLVAFATMLIIRWRLRSLKTRNALLRQMVQERTKELERSNTNILQQKEQLERIDASKNQLFNNISHEFRTPLTLIQGYADALLTPPAGETIAINKPATSIKEQAIRLNRMIQEIMDLSKLEQGVINLKKEPIEWTTFLRTEFYLFESQALQKRLDYQLQIEPDQKVYVSIDRQKVERILQNLISNAIKFTPAAGRIRVQCAIREEEIEVVVADTGPGILPEEQAHVFDRYFQGSAPPQSSQTGYGIGLALCREYVELMQGRIWVESRPGEGASFFVVFPRELASLPAATPPEQTTADKALLRPFEPLPHPRQQSRLLIVEDNEQIRAFLVEILAGDYYVNTAANGEEALALLEREPDIDLILSDVMMPVVDGFTLLQKTRSHPTWGFIPFMIITALTAEEGKLQALRLGVDAFLTKPFEVIELKTQIQNLLRNQELRKAFLTQSTPASSHKGGYAHLHQAEASPGLSYDEQWMSELQAAVLEGMARFDFKVSSLAFQMHISERTLRNYLNAYTGLSPSEFLQKARLDRAYQLAKDKKYRTIAELAYAVGFKDPKHFSKLFSKEFGKSPADYLK